MMTHSVKKCSTKSLYFNKLARFGQFIKYTLLRSPLSPHLVPISAAEGPHLVPISLEMKSPFGPHFEFFLSPFHVGAVAVQCNKYNNLPKITSPGVPHPAPPIVHRTEEHSEWGRTSLNPERTGQATASRRGAWLREGKGKVVGLVHGVYSTSFEK